MRKSLANRIKQSNHPAARAARWLRRSVRTLSLPAPRAVVVPMLFAYLALREAYSFALRVLVCEPLFKAYCTRYGRRFRTGDYVHWVQGQGDIILGDDVLLDGKSTFTFASLFPERPALVIGDGSGIAHGCTVVVAKRVEIGKNSMIATGTWIFDSPGHQLDPAARLAKLPPRAEDVKPICIGDNVWIGRNCSIFPGVTIGDGSVISAGSVVTNDVPAYTVVAGFPARKILTLKNPHAVPADAPPAAVH